MAPFAARHGNGGIAPSANLRPVAAPRRHGTYFCLICRTFTVHIGSISGALRQWTDTKNRVSTTPCDQLTQWRTASRAKRIAQVVKETPEAGICDCVLYFSGAGTKSDECPLTQAVAGEYKAYEFSGAVERTRKTVQKCTGREGDILNKTIVFGFAAALAVVTATFSTAHAQQAGQKKAPIVKATHGDWQIQCDKARVPVGPANNAEANSSGKGNKASSGQIEFRDEVPVSNVGKVLRRVLRDEEMAK